MFFIFLAYFSLLMQETQETQVPSLAWEETLEKGMATHSIILA